MSGRRTRRHQRADPRRKAITRIATSPMTWLAVAVLAAIALLGAAAVTTLAERDWASVVAVDGRAINRAQVRDRESIVAFLGQQRSDWHASLVRTGRMSAAEAAVLQVATDADVGDPHPEAVEGLIQGALVDAELDRRGATRTSVDPAEALIDARLAATAQRVRWVQANWTGVGDETPPRDEELHTLGEAIRSALQSGSDPAEVAREYTSGPWTTNSSEQWIPRTGPVAGLEPEALAAIRSTATGPVPIDAGTGWVTVAEVIDTAILDRSAFGAAALEDAKAGGISSSALESSGAGPSRRAAVARPPCSRVG